MAAGLVIGVLGAFGDVGAHAVRVLESLGLGPVLLGARRSGVDYRDSSLDEFVAACRVVVNCAGPSTDIGDRVLRAAERAGADYVDATGSVWPTDRVAVVGAGLQPGLTGLLPRWVARTHGPSPELAVHVAVLDRFTAAAGLDYLRGTNEPLAAWRDGGPVARAATRHRAVLPFLPGEVTVLPFLDDEARRTAQALGLESGDWASAVSGEHVLRAFDRIHGLSEPEAVDALCRASSLDLAGRVPHALVAVHTEGRTFVVRGRGNGELTGTVVAHAVKAVVDGVVPQGCHHADEVLDPAVVDQLEPVELDVVEGAL